MKLLIPVAFVAVLLGACAPQVSAANSRGGVINHVNGLTQADALKKADDVCASHGRVARISGESDLNNTMTFDCVAP